MSFPSVIVPQDTVTAGLPFLVVAGVERVYATDTIERTVSDVSAAPAVADEL